MFVILSKDHCTFCDTAKAMLEGRQIQYNELNIASDKNKWIVYLMKKSGITTVPQVFNNKGVYIGGLTQLKEYLTNV